MYLFGTLLLLTSSACGTELANFKKVAVKPTSVDAFDLGLRAGMTDLCDMECHDLQDCNFVFRLLARSSCQALVSSIDLPSHKSLITCIFM